MLKPCPAAWRASLRHLICSSQSLTCTAWQSHFGQPARATGGAWPRTKANPAFSEGLPSDVVARGIRSQAAYTGFVRPLLVRLCYRRAVVLKITPSQLPSLRRLGLWFSQMCMWHHVTKTCLLTMHDIAWGNGAYSAWPRSRLVRRTSMWTYSDRILVRAHCTSTFFPLQLAVECLDASGNRPALPRFKLWATAAHASAR